MLKIFDIGDTINKQISLNSIQPATGFQYKFDVLIHPNRTYKQDAPDLLKGHFTPSSEGCPLVPLENRKKFMDPFKNFNGNMDEIYFKIDDKNQEYFPYPTLLMKESIYQ